LGAVYRSKAIAGWSWQKQLVAYLVVGAIASVPVYRTVKMNKPIESKAPEHSRIQFMVPGTNLENDPLLPFREGETPAVNVMFFNAGQFSILSARVGAVVVLVPIDDESQAWRKYEKTLTMRPPGGAMTPAPNAIGQISFGSFEASAPLSREDVAALTDDHPTKAICVLAKVEWSDKTGRYETDEAQCIQHDRYTSYSWHSLEANNTEKLLGD
jgi:hypothetical protein